MTDEELVQQSLLSNDTQHYGTIYNRYALKVFQKCISFTKDQEEAKDLAHDIMVKVYLSLAKFKGKSKFSTWLYSITYNHCVDHQAKKKKQLTLAEEMKLQVEDIQYDESSEEVMMRMRLDRLTELLEQITVTEKSLLLMKYQDGFSIKEIAELTNCGESAIKMKLKRSKSKLVSLYEKGRE